MKYLELGLTRSLLQAYKDERIPPNKKGERNKAGQSGIKSTPSSWDKSSQDWLWQQRAAVWDEYDLEERRKRWDERAEQQREIHHEEGGKLLAKADEMLDYALSKVEMPTDYEMVIDPKERARILHEVGVDVEQMEEKSGGMPIIVIQMTSIQPTRWSMRDAAILAETGARIQNQAAGVLTSQSEVSLSARNKKGEPFDLFPIKGVHVISAPPPKVPDDTDKAEDEDNQDVQE